MRIYFKELNVEHVEDISEFKNENQEEKFPPAQPVRCYVYALYKSIQLAEMLLRESDAIVIKTDNRSVAERCTEWQKAVMHGARLNWPDKEFDVLFDKWKDFGVTRIRVTYVEGPYAGRGQIFWAHGTCYGEGESEARAGIGLYEDDNRTTYSERLSGLQCKIRASIWAAIRAVQLAGKRVRNEERLGIYIDSRYVEAGFNKWKQQGRSANFKALKYKDDFMKLFDEIERSNLKVRIVHESGSHIDKAKAAAEAACF